MSKTIKKNIEAQQLDAVLSSVPQLLKCISQHGGFADLRRNISKDSNGPMAMFREQNSIAKCIPNELFTRITHTETKPMIIRVKCDRDVNVLCIPRANESNDHRVLDGVSYPHVRQLATILLIRLLAVQKWLWWVGKTHTNRK